MVLTKAIDARLEHLGRRRPLRVVVLRLEQGRRGEGGVGSDGTGRASCLEPRHLGEYVEDVHLLVHGDDAELDEEPDHQVAHLQQRALERRVRALAVLPADSASAGAVSIVGR